MTTDFTQMAREMWKSNLAFAFYLDAEPTVVALIAAALQRVHDEATAKERKQLAAEARSHDFTKNERDAARADLKRAAELLYGLVDRPRLPTEKTTSQVELTAFLAEQEKK